MIQKHLPNEVDLNNLEPVVLTGHIWRQRGIELVCTSCTKQHAYYLGYGVKFFGLDEEGKPILRKVY